MHLMSLLGYPEAITVPIQYNSPGHLRDGDGHDDVSLNYMPLYLYLSFS